MNKWLSLIKRNKIKAGFIITAFFNILFIHFYFPRFFIEPNNLIIELINKTPVKLSPKDFALNYKNIDVVTKDNIHIKGYKIYTNASNNNGTVIFLHGIRAYKEHFLPISKVLSEKGYNSVLVDLRAHGESGGKYCTFGYNEKNDIVSLVDEIMKDELLNKNIGIWGQSLGGAIAIQTMEIDQRIKYGIVESTFSDFHSVSNEYLKRLLPIDAKWFSDYLSYRIDQIADFKNETIQPKECVKNISQPVLLVHGDKDKRIHFYHALINYKNLKSKNKTLLRIKGANHLNVWKKGGNQYLNKVLCFLESNCSTE